MKVDTLRKFINQCRKLQQKGWKARLRGERIVLIAPGAKKTRYCPITAVCMERTGRYFSQFDSEAAAIHIGMDNTIKNYVIKASNGVAPIDEPCVVDLYYNIRRNLLQIFSLPASSVFEQPDYPERKKFNERLKNPRSRIGRIVSTQALRKSSQHIQRVIVENIVAHGAGAIIRRH